MILNDEIQDKIRNIIENDGVIAFVTDTVWGLGCLPESQKAVEKIYAIKGREKEKPLILMSDDIYPLLDYVKEVPPVGQKLIKKYFPGALTVVVPKSEKTPDYLTSNFSTVGIRVPDNEVFKNICLSLKNRVLATTSANMSHEQPALCYEEALKILNGKADLIIEAYGCEAKGVASTIVGFENGKVKIFRQGELQL